MTDNNQYYQWILEDFDLKDEDVLSVYRHGSMIYGTNDHQSDNDFIIIVKDHAVECDSKNSSYHNIDVGIQRQSTFQDLINRHKNFALDCYFLPQEFRLKDNAKFTFKLDLNNLRKEISAKSSNSFVKCKKKLEVVADRNVKIAKKSLFHSMGIIDFGIQIATHGKIVDYSSSNHLWFEIRDNPADTWEPYKEKYQTVYNSKMTAFRKLAPINEKNNKT